MGNFSSGGFYACPKRVILELFYVFPSSEVEAGSKAEGRVLTEFWMCYSEFELSIKYKQQQAKSQNEQELYDEQAPSTNKDI